MVIEDEISRQLSYAKRRNGLLKKALELFSTCGVDCLFMSFSSSGRLSYFCGDKRVEDILEHFISMPMETRNFHFTEEEELLGMISELKEQSMEQLRKDPTYVALEKQIAKAKEDLEIAKAELRRKYEPIPGSITTIEEAEFVEANILGALARVQARMKQLEEAQGNDQPQPFDDMGEAEYQSGDSSSKNQDQMTNQALGTGSSQVPVMDENWLENEFLAEMSSPYRPQMSESSWSNLLLLSDDLPDDTLSSMMETSVLSSPPPDQSTEGSQSFNKTGIPTDDFSFPTADPPSPNYQSKMTLGEGSSTAVFNSPQRANQGNSQPNPTQTGQRSSFQQTLDSVSETGSMYPPHAGLLLPPPIPGMNHQGTQAWDLEEIERRIANMRNRLPPSPRPQENDIYSTGYEMMGKPADPHVRNLVEIAKAAEGSKNSGQNPKP